jgi:hypothetical protein
MLARLFRNGGSGGSVGQAVVVCQAAQEGLSAVRARPSNGGFQLQARAWSTPPTAQEARWLAGARVVLLLPKSAYLIRQLDVPAGCESEIGSVIRLAAEVLLPPDFDQAEVSYRRIAQKEATARYEVYVIRRDKLAAALSRAAALGVEAQWVLPSAWVHAAVVDRLGGVDVLVDHSPDRTEIALPRGDGGLSVRSVAGGLKGAPGPTPTGDRELLECIRSLGKPGRTGGPIRIGWTHQAHRLEELDGKVEHCSVLELLWPGLAADAAQASLAVAACTIAQSDPRLLAEASLLPAPLRHARQRRRMGKRLKAAAALVAAGLVLTYAALEISNARYRAKRSQLQAQVEKIGTEGEAIGRRIDQLRLVRNLRASRDDLALLLAGLSEATPDGVTYSQIDLAEDGRLRLRGQARSLSLPYLLPGLLKAQPMFDQILLIETGQVKKAGGSVTEFRLEAKLRRSTP